MFASRIAMIVCFITSLNSAVTGVSPPSTRTELHRNAVLYVNNFTPCPSSPATPSPAVPALPSETPCACLPLEMTVSRGAYAKASGTTMSVPVATI